MKSIATISLVTFLLLKVSVLYAQAPTPSATTDTVIAAGNYERGKLHRFLFGKHYRREWNTPVRAQLLQLDTAFGGLTPYLSGGGRQTKTLRLHDRDRREYVLRSLDKSFGRALPDIMQGTFVETLIDDQVTIAHPYAALTIPPMANAAGIYHCNPLLRFVPGQPALDSFNDYYANQLFLLEQRPDENWSTEPNFGNSENIIGTDKLLENLLQSNQYRVDHLLYVRSRLFDILIGDWGRHEDNWRWASFQKEGYTWYQPVPRDRDQAYSVFDGKLVKLVLSAANLDHLQSFDHDVKDIRTYSFPARHLDRRMTNETTRAQWVAVARELQQTLSDSVIAYAVRQMPPEVFPVSGNDLIEKLRSRRDKLEAYAGDYYDFLAHHVDVPGSQEREYFEVRRLSDEETAVKLFALHDDGSRAEQPFYNRVFKTSETRDVRLFGIGGKDVFDIDGTVNKSVTVRIIGGPENDSVSDRGQVNKENGKTAIYDNHDNRLDVSRATKLRLSDDEQVHLYNYREFEYHKKGVKFTTFYDNPDRWYVGAGYGFKRRMWRREPYGFEQSIYVRYSLMQNAFSLLYEGRFNRIIGKWNGRISVNQDFIRWTNFYGLGNETVNDERRPRRYYQLRTDEFLGTIGINRQFGKYHQLELNGFFSAVQVVDDPDRYVGQFFTPNELYFFRHHRYAGGRAGYTFQRIDNPLMPERGAMLYAGAAYTQNVQQQDKGFASFNGIAQIFVPLVGKFSLSLRAGLAHVEGTPEFYQYASIGGSQTLRGYRRDRFWGKTAFYNTNELRWITDVRSHLMNGKVGIVGFFDEGRVWMPGESSDIWHYGYGGGFLVSPFNAITASVTYGLSEEEGRFHIRVYRTLKF